jgi:hypothetical protein
MEEIRTAEEPEPPAAAVEPATAPFTSGLQFSAYSRQPQLAYRPPSTLQAPRPAPTRGPDHFLYGRDALGNAQYMDGKAMAEVLQTPQAMKVRPRATDNLPPQAMMTYLAAGQQAGGRPIPSRLQETYRPVPARPPAPRSRPLVQSAFQLLPSVLAACIYGYLPVFFMYFQPVFTGIYGIHWYLLVFTGIYGVPCSRAGGPHFHERRHSACSSSAPRTTCLSWRTACR